MWLQHEMEIIKKTDSVVIFMIHNIENIFCFGLLLNSTSRIVAIAKLARTLGQAWLLHIFCFLS